MTPAKKGSSYMTLQKRTYPQDMDLHMTLTYFRRRRTLLRNSIWSSGLIRPRNVITYPSHMYVLAKRPPAPAVSTRVALSPE